MTWAYGVTTVPERAGELLPRTLVSLHLAGFSEPALFVDGCTDPEAYVGLAPPARVRCLPERVGPFGNWLLGLWQLYIQNPAVERYAMFQDDVLAVQNLRHYLDTCKYPADGYWNLFTFLNSDRVVTKPGWVQGPTLNSGADPRETLQCGRGALGLVFSREALFALLSSPSFTRKPASHDHPRDKIDGGVVAAMNAAGYREYVHGPSLLSHTGTKTSIREPGKAGKVWESNARTFPGEVDILTYMRSGAR